MGNLPNDAQIKLVRVRTTNEHDGIAGLLAGGEIPDSAPVEGFHELGSSGPYRTYRMALFEVLNLFFSDQ